MRHPESSLPDAGNPGPTTYMESFSNRPILKPRAGTGRQGTSARGGTKDDDVDAWIAHAPVCAGRLALRSVLAHTSGSLRACRPSPAQRARAHVATNGGTFPGGDRERIRGKALV